MRTESFFKEKKNVCETEKDVIQRTFSEFHQLDFSFGSECQSK